MAVQHDGVRFGAAYYYEYAGPGDDPKPETLERDLDLMQAAAFSVIRVGESVWSTWEPEEGRFELDWLEPVLDGALARGIDVVLGTPTYALPMWLVRRYPEVAGELRTGQPMGWGARQEADFTHPAFRFHAERILHQDRRALPGPPGRRRLPGGQRARAAPAAQRRGVPAVRRPPRAHVRRRRDPQPRVGSRVLVAPAVHLGGPVDPGRQRPAAVRPRVATVPGVADHRDDRLAGQGRPEAGPRRPVRHHLHRLRPTGPRGRRPRVRPRRHQRERLLRDAGLAAAPEPHARAAVLDGARHLGAVPGGRRDVLEPRRAVPRDRDQRAVHRRPEHQLPGLPRAVAAVRLGARRARRPDGRVLALAHAALRRRDVLGWRPAAQRPARAGPTESWPCSAPSSRGSGGRWRTRCPTPTSRSCRRPTSRFALAGQPPLQNAGRHG